MSKIWIVLKSEFFRRVRSKWFIIGTLCAPLILIMLFVGPAILGIVASETDQKSIVVLDDTSIFEEGLNQHAGEQYSFTMSGAPPQLLRQEVLDGNYYGYLFIPKSLLEGKGEATFYSVEGSGLSGESRLERALTRSLEAHRLAQFNLSDEIKDVLATSVSVRTVKISEDGGEEADTAAFFSILGYVMGFIIYMAMFLYGAYVIQGVLEEKTTRVIEVMVSSVRPFDMLVGKVLGIGAVGIVQMVVWAGLMLGAALMAGNVIAMFVDPSEFSLPAEASQEELLQAIDFSMPSISPSIFVWFVLFFIGGYLLYSSLFAAVSSMVEQQQDAQGLLMPIYALIIIPMMFMVFLVESPNSTLAVTLSMIPFFSPILMVVRAAVTEVPFWQIALSYVLLLATFVGAMWVSSRIYRVGILMYGKKPGLKDLLRWVKYQ